MLDSEGMHVIPVHDLRGREYDIVRGIGCDGRVQRPIETFNLGGISDEIDIVDDRKALLNPIARVGMEQNGAQLGQIVHGYACPKDAGIPSSDAHR